MHHFCSNTCTVGQIIVNN
ncbi:hypothetical protein AB4501_18340 [Vibrio sp. 10N.222.55.E8]